MENYIPTLSNQMQTRLNDDACNACNLFSEQNTYSLKKFKFFRFLKARDVTASSSGFSFFFRWVMSYFGLTPLDIAPNSMLNISNYVVFCEDYLQIAPSLALFSKSSTATPRTVRIKLWAHTEGLHPM